MLYRLLPSHAPDAVLEVEETENVHPGDDVRQTVDNGEFNQMFDLRPVTTDRPPLTDPSEEVPQVPAGIFQGEMHVLVHWKYCVSSTQVVL